MAPWLAPRVFMTAARHLPRSARVARRREAMATYLRSIYSSVDLACALDFDQGAAAQCCTFFYGITFGEDSLLPFNLAQFVRQRAVFFSPFVRDLFQYFVCAVYRRFIIQRDGTSISRFSCSASAYGRYSRFPLFCLFGGSGHMHDLL